MPVEPTDTVLSAGIEELDAWLAAAEQTAGGVIPGTEKTILWHGDQKQTDLALVYVHGFSASRQETAPLADRVADRLGANLFYTRLTGHGQGAEAMLDGSEATWLADLREAYQVGSMIGRQVVIIAVSTGATLALDFAVRDRPGQLAGLVMISPNFGLRNRKVMFMDRFGEMGLKAVERVMGENYNGRALNADHERYWSLTYPLRAMLPMIRLVHRVRQLDFSDQLLPLQVIYSPLDTVVDSAWTERALASWPSDRYFPVRFTSSRSASQHVLAGRVQAPESTAEMAGLIARFIAERVAKLA